MVLKPAHNRNSEHTELQPDAALRLQAEQYVVKELAAAAKSNKLKGFERIAAVHLEPEAFSAENGLMTPSFKLKRPQLQKHYQKLIDECALPPRADVHTHLTVHGAREAAPDVFFESTVWATF